MYYLSLTLFAALIVAADQFTKYLAAVYLTGKTVVLIPDFLQLHFITNNGMALSMLSGARWLFVVLAFVFLVAAVLIVVKKWMAKPFEHWCLAAIVGGAVGNLIDRIVSGEVVDMICVPWFSTFNVADIFITVPAVLLVIYILFFDREFFKDAPEKAEEKPDDDPS